ncbi:unnamed protein product [Penicillium salamii]|nr:unnamed protein product [Penicillium salamii]CAG8105488.1 unnamed protein product [Penicillium salamii]CAG8406582.1 unnamed protein product [Penicillium salamii]
MPPRRGPRKSTRIQKSKKQPLTGSPKDQIARVPILLQELDLDVSHAHSSRASGGKQVRQPKRKTWTKWSKKNPLIDPEKLPKGWHMNEPDLATDDIEGQIKRCHERIAENIIPDIFKQRLKEYTIAKEENEEMRLTETQKNPGSKDLSFAVIQRLNVLEAMKADLEGARDASNPPHTLKQLTNINALLEAYRSKKIDWNDGLVTYWSNGIQICQPRNFDWDEFEVINSEYRDEGAFWTEGLDGPEPEPSYTSLTVGASGYSPKLIGVKLAIRIPNVPWFAEFDFVHDTGCTLMGLYRGDIATLLGPHASIASTHPPIIGRSEVRSSNGARRSREVIEVEITILDQNRQRMVAWTRVPCALIEGNWTPNAVPRLDGPVLRDLLYTATAPDLQRLYHFANTAADIQNVLPVLDLANNPPSLPDIYYTAIKRASDLGTASPTQLQISRIAGLPRPKDMPTAAPGAPP